MKSFKQHLKTPKSSHRNKNGETIQHGIDEFLPNGEQNPEFHQEHNTQAMLFGVNDHIPFDGDDNIKEEHSLQESVEPHPTNPNRLIIRTGSQSSAGDEHKKGIIVPKHMWNGGKTPEEVKSKKAAETVKRVSKGLYPLPEKKSRDTRPLGMDERNGLRAEVYGKENRKPLNLGQIYDQHKTTLEDHFKKPEHEQIAAEKKAIGRLKAAGHLDSGSTLDKGEKTDTVEHETDEQGRTHVGYSSKGVAGHAVYTSGHGENEQHHILNTCPGQTVGCGGGVDSKNLHDTLKGSCFAPRAESQYVNASIRRATHAQAKHDPAMTNDWILAHTHSLRNAAEKADKKNKRMLFRPNVTDESDRSSRHAINGINKQRKAKGLPPIIANSYGKTNELHDPENNYHVTFSNTGPKVKHDEDAGTKPAEVPENNKSGRDKLRINQTISATSGDGKDIKNDEGKNVPPKNSYMVTNIKRDSDKDKRFQQHVTHVKYWSKGREEHELSDDERKEGDEGHFDGEGKSTTPDKAHYGHTTITRNDGKKIRYDYQKQHVLHPRYVAVGKNADGTPHTIPTDSRFKDNDFLPKAKDRFKSKNGKIAGGIVITTPTTSTSDSQHNSNFTHHVNDKDIEHARMHDGELQVDKPEHQEAARGNEYVAPEPIHDEPKKNKKN
jgi:hypothetical protein